MTRLYPVTVAAFRVLDSHRFEPDGAVGELFDSEEVLERATTPEAQPRGASTRSGASIFRCARARKAATRTESFWRRAERRSERQSNWPTDRPTARPTEEPIRMRRSPGLRLQAAVVQDNVPTEVCEGLFIGSVHAGFNVEALKEKRITHVLNLAGNYATFPEDFTYLSISVRDKEHSNLLSCLPIAMVFIDGGVKVGGVLVHCSGGRSRSPAVVVAYLMIRKKLSFQDAHARVKALRPVVSLNAGFEEQLRCLDAARGDIFLANQLVLAAKMKLLTHQLQTGELLSATTAHKKKALRHGSCKSFRHASMPTGSFQLAFDERDMLCGKVPSGYCLSMPFPQSKKRCDSAPSDSSTTEFIPALRSMATVFGCRECGTGLYCASAILQHKVGASGSVEGLMGEPLGGDQVHLETVVDCVSGADRPVIDVEPGVKSVEPVDATKKKPLLAKLLLRPQSPSVSSVSGDSAGKNGKLGGDSRVKRSPMATSSSHNADGGSQGGGTCDGAADRRPGLLQTVRGRIPTHHNKYDKENSDNASASSSRSASLEEMAPIESGHIIASITTTSASQRGQTLWRSIATLKAAKRSLKDAIDKRAGSRSESEAGSRSKKPVTPSSTGRNTSTNVIDTGDSAFLQDNTRLWEQGIRQILQSGLAKGTGDTAACPAVRQLGAILDADARALEAAMEALGDCRSWFVEPQGWFLEAAAGAPTGQIRCPNDECACILGEWHWDGTRCVCGAEVCDVAGLTDGGAALTHEYRCSCGEWVGPAFAMNKECVRVLGVLTTRSSPQMVAGRAADTPVAADKLSQTW
jgi:hypothetical protein